MKVSLLVALAALIVVAAAQEPRQRTRQKLRALTEAARNGDIEAQAKLRQLREHRKILRDREGNPIRRRRPRPTQQKLDEAPPPDTKPIRTTVKRIRIPVKKQRVDTVEEPTTFRPPTESTFAPTLEIVTEPPTLAPQVFKPSPIKSDTVRQTITRIRPQERRPIATDLEPHRAINRGLEVDTRSERFNPAVRVLDKTTRTPPVETIRRYSYFDEEGAYVFGYEAADGSFKEERRRPDCVVEGKYGYVDPDGVRREFNYISGNQCDPNAPTDPELQETLPLNKQFMHQTNEQKLTEEELKSLQFRRSRKPVPKVDQPVRDSSRNVVTGSRRNQQIIRQRPIQSSRQEQQTIRERPTQPSRQEQPIETTTVAQEPRFTTPESFTQFRNPDIQEEGPTARPQFNPIPIPEIPNLRPRPTPIPVSFDFDQEFKSIFKNFATDPKPSNRPVSRPRPRPRPAPTPVSRPTTPRPPPPPPPPSKPVSNNVLSHFAPATFATFRPTQPAPPVTSPPAQKPFVDNALTLTPEKPKLLVFDENTRTFKKVNSGGSQAQSFRPLTHPRPSVPATQRPVTQSTGVPLDIFSQPSQPRRSNPLPSIPQSTAEFDNFFKQFNLQF